MQFNIKVELCRFLYKKDICDVKEACIVIHNMIVEILRDLLESNMTAMKHVKDVYNKGKSFKWQWKEVRKEKLQSTSINSHTLIWIRDILVEVLN